MAWLTTRNEDVKLGANHDCAVVPELIKEFALQQNLPSVRDNYTDHLVPMKDPKAGCNCQ